MTTLAELSEIFETDLDVAPDRRVINFISALPAVTGEAARKEERFKLAPWQVPYLRKLYGALDWDDRRKYQMSYLEIPRKNGKSTLAAALVLYGLFVEQEPGGELYSVAYTKEQARIVYNVASLMVKKMPAAAQELVRVRDYYAVIEHYDSGAVYAAIAAERRGSYGKNPSLIVFDELHVQKSRELWDTMRTSMGARREPLLIAITTAGDDKTSICWEIHADAEKVLNGVHKDPSFLPLIFAADPNDDWTDPQVWAKANPSLGYTLSESWLAKECANAQRNPAAQNTFLREHLNIWTSQTTRWIDMHEWEECKNDEAFEPVASTECFGGLDMASKIDLAAFVLVFRDEKDIQILPYFWMPSDRVLQRTKDEGIPFSTWVDQGLITATPGNRIDFERVESDILALAHWHEIVQIGYDPWNSEATAQRLAKAGLTLVPMRQNYGDLSEPSKELEALVVSRQIRHNAHPVMDWCMANVEVRTDKATGNICPVRPEDRRLKVDGVMGAVMALGRLMVSSEEEADVSLLVLG